MDFSDYTYKNETVSVKPVDAFDLPPFDIFPLKYWLFVQRTVFPWLSKACEYEARDWVSVAKHLVITF